VDDEPAMRELMRKSLRAAGVGVRLAAGGKEALEEVDQKIPDAMMVDLMMPEMNGIELIFRLRSRPELEKTPIIVVSAKELDEDDLHALGGTIDRFIAKSELREWDLAATVRQALRERENRSHHNQGRPRRRVEIPPLPNLSLVKGGAGVTIEER